MSLKSESRGLWLDGGLAALLFALALLVRFFLLREIPPGLYNDEAAYANDALGVLKGQHALFFERNNGREPLFIYLLALTFRFFEATPHTIRATSALLGALTAPAAYWMAVASARMDSTARPAAARWMGVWVGLFMAFSYWHISFSRVGFRAITLPLVMSLAFVWVWRMWRRLRDEEGLPWSDLLLAGLFLGLTFYTYTSGRLALVVFWASALWALWRGPALGMLRRKVIRAAMIVSLVALVVIAPLAGYFFAHPDSFAARAASVSIFSEEFAPDGPVAALIGGTIKTLRMFFDTVDQNLRHNPAQRPVVDPVLGLWIAAGVVLALARWRKLSPLVYLAWALMMMAPALFSAEGVPHSLRTIGMMPAVFVLAVEAMLWVGALLTRERFIWGALLPLPFFLYGAIGGLTDYFGAWTPPERMRPAFLVDEMQMAEAIAQRGGNEVWILALSPNYYLTDTEFNTVTFIVRDRARYATVLTAEAAAAAELARVAQGGERVNVLHPYEKPELSETSFVFLDAKNLLDFILRRNGRLVEQRDGEELGGIPYTVYDLNPDRDFSVPQVVELPAVTYGDTVKLTGATLGAVGVLAGSAADGAISLAGDNSLWAVLRFEPLRPVNFDLKTSLTLVNAEGRLAAQVDGLLVGDRYPVERVWEAGESTHSYAILAPLPAVPPGEYELRLGVYEDVSGRIYTAVKDGGVPGPTASLGTVQIRPPAAPALVDAPMAASGPEAEGVRLAGYDPLPETVSPGVRLPLTLYWQARSQPVTDLLARAELLNRAGESVQSVVAALGGDGWPTTAWRTGETVRQWPDLSIGADLPSGEYSLVVSLIAEDEVQASAQLGTVRVEGRSRLFNAPPLSVISPATFGAEVRLLGTRAERPLRLDPGRPLTFTLVWQPLQTAQQPLVRFVQLLNAQGALVAQQDTIPCAQACPSTSWLADEILLDDVTMELPADLADGEYRVVVGWYDGASQQRLPAADGDGQVVGDGAFALPLVLQR